MVLISIQPFALPKIFLVIAALLCFSALCFADPIFVAQRYTSPASRGGAELKRVDLPPRGQQALPWGEEATESAFPQSETGLPVLVISGHLAYT